MGTLGVHEYIYYEYFDILRYRKIDFKLMKESIHKVCQSESRSPSMFELRAIQLWPPVNGQIRVKGESGERERERGEDHAPRSFPIPSTHHFTLFIPRDR